jgi:Transposase IS4
MIAEEEIAGASNSAADAPSLTASRVPPRHRQPSQKARENDDSQSLPTRGTTSRKRKRQATFEVYQDLPTPPRTQKSTPPSQPGPQIGIDPSDFQKKRPKTKPNLSSLRPKTPEEWEVLFEAATTSQAKLQVLLEALGHEDFPDCLHIPVRLATANVEDLDPLDPLSLWSKFVAPEILKIMAQNTNDNEALQYEAKQNHTKHERAWHDITGADVGAFIGAAMLMGVHPQHCLEDYWNCSEDKPIFPLQKYMTRQRFEQISRYFKVNSPHEVVTDKEFWRKVEPLMSSFREACQLLITPSDTASIDENLVSSRHRSSHLIQIDNKAAGKGYKIYTLALHYYLYDWAYTSKKTPVPQAKGYTPQHPDHEAFTDTERMVLTLVERLLATQPKGNRFQIVFDNFFTSTRLFTELRAWGVSAYGTARAGSGMPKPHIVMDKVCSKERNYGEVVNSVGKHGVNFITYVDQGAVWMMSTTHNVANDPTCWRDSIKRPKASDHLARTSIDGGIELPFPQISYDYNHHMNGSDLCQQVWNEYTTSRHTHFRSWWPLFWQLIDASIANVLYLYRLKGFSRDELSHSQLQERLGLQLLRNPASVSRIIKSTSHASTKRPTLLRRPTNEHTWERITRRYCVVCKPPPRERGKGKVLQELGNYNTRDTRDNTVPRKRTKQTTWGCVECQVAVCKSPWCWRKHRGDTNEGNDEAGETEEPAET